MAKNGGGEAAPSGFGNSAAAGEVEGELDLEGDGEDGGARAFPGPAERRPGRPKGSPNRKTELLQRYYLARGFKDPIGWMGELLTMLPVEALRWFREQQRAVTGSAEGAPTLIEVVDLQRRVAADLAPYLHGKMPIRIDHGDERLPVLIIRGDTDQLTLRREGQAQLSAGSPLEDVEMAETLGSEDGDE